LLLISLSFKKHFHKHNFLSVSDEEQAAALAALPEWSVHLDEQHGTHFWVDAATGESQWHAPGSSADTQGLGYDEQVLEAAVSARDAEEWGGGWTRHFDPVSRPLPPPRASFSFHLFPSST